MKNVTVILAAIIFLTSCASTTPKESERSILGNWDAHGTFEGKAFVLEGRFKPGGDYDGFDNGKLFVSGKYRLAGDTIFIKDGLCNMTYEGAYKLTYYKDSVRFNVIEDTCIGRKNGSDKLAMGRIASSKN
ncbi:hypothetical protein [Ferruginibacter sp.]|uniref:hypothetical protein n=1 Tax=Ferruginibacter sp. TaxID=1940288 RepID=UPI00199BCD6F|nr:hypothetical protein [Ferruginibacter sp.]MBC7626816.1 hypothetical protein [Ferruginibacter sp.]